MKNAKTMLRKILLIGAVITAMTVTGCKQPVKKDKGGEVKTFAVTVTQPANGNIRVKRGWAVLTGNALKTIEENTELEITLTANGGYKAVKLVVGGEEKIGSASGGRKISQKVIVTKDIIIEGETEKKTGDVKTYAVTLSQPQNGTITVKNGGMILGMGDLKAVAENTELEITLTAESGYKAVKLVINGTEETKSADGGKSITQAVTVTNDIAISGETAGLGGEADKSFEVDGINFSMKYIAAVSNASLGHSAYKNNQPHNVSLHAYFIGKTEVTQNLWKTIMGNNPSNFKNNAADEEIQDLRPVEQVSWYDCIAFCNELTKKINNGADTECVYYSDKDFGYLYTKEDASAKKLPYQNFSKKGFRLPTEAEWEWACMGGTENRWAGTDDKTELKNYAWYKDDDGGDSGGKTHEVKKKLPNEYGLYDMSGNVWEWCWDWYTNWTPQGGQENPVGEMDGTKRVLRGGTWNLKADYAGRAIRSYHDPDRDYRTIGFRLVCRM